jgi:hypothetical protein
MGTGFRRYDEGIGGASDGKSFRSAALDELAIGAASARLAGLRQSPVRLSPLFRQLRNPVHGVDAAGGGAAPSADAQQLPVWWAQKALRMLVKTWSNCDAPI